MIRQILFFAALIIPGSLIAQDSLKNESTLSVNADLVSRYVWRGSILGDAKPNIQPYITFCKSGFSAGAWGSSSVGGNYNEVDLFASYNIKYFTLLVTDYFTDYEAASKMHYFDYGDSTTLHSFEGALSFDGTEKIPLKILAAVYFYGYDKDSLGENYYSTYLEAAYTASIHETEVGISLGFTPMEGLYGSEPGVVNIGISALREIKITDKFSLPVQGSLIVNPQTENIWFVLAVKL
jgi:hypothetical protein